MPLQKPLCVCIVVLVLALKQTVSSCRINFPCILFKTKFYFQECFLKQQMIVKYLRHESLCIVNFNEKEVA